MSLCLKKWWSANILSQLNNSAIYASGTLSQKGDDDKDLSAEEQAVPRLRHLWHSWNWTPRKLRHCLMVEYVLFDRRKFKSQTSDNMDRWKSRAGQSQRREEKSREEKRREEKKEDQRRERVRRKQMQHARKGRKVAKHYVFPCFSNDLRLRRVEK